MIKNGEFIARSDGNFEFKRRHGSVVPAGAHNVMKIFRNNGQI